MFCLGLDCVLGFLISASPFWVVKPIIQSVPIIGVFKEGSSVVLEILRGKHCANSLSVVATCIAVSA